MNKNYFIIPLKFIMLITHIILFLDNNPESIICINNVKSTDIFKCYQRNTWLY
jgi:hypothetical protein